MKSEAKDAVLTDPKVLTKIMSLVQKHKPKLIVRPDINPDIQVRGFPAKPQEKGTMVLGDITPKGMEALQGAANLKIECGLINQKLEFVVRVRALGTEEVTTSFPNRIVVRQRRKNSRFTANPKQQIFVHLNFNLEKGDRLLSPANIHQYSDRVRTYSVKDISLGGFCLFSIFPALKTRVVVGEALSSTIFFPMQSPIHCRIYPRWIRTVRETSVVTEGIYYHIGCEFEESSKHLNATIRKFAQNLTEDTAL